VPPRQRSIIDARTGTHRRRRKLARGRRRRPSALRMLPEIVIECWAISTRPRPTETATTRRPRRAVVGSACCRDSSPRRVGSLR